MHKSDLPELEVRICLDSRALFFFADIKLYNSLRLNTYVSFKERVDVRIARRADIHILQETHESPGTPNEMQSIPSRVSTT